MIPYVIAFVLIAIPCFLFGRWYGWHSHALAHEEDWSAVYWLGHNAGVQQAARFITQWRASEENVTLEPRKRVDIS